MLFAFICFDRADSAEERQRSRAEHIVYMGNVLKETVFGGPLLHEKSGRTIGSIFAIEFDDRAAAEAFIAQEPYTRDGVFETVDIYPWRQMVPELYEGALADELEKQNKLAAQDQG